MHLDKRLIHSAFDKSLAPCFERQKEPELVESKTFTDKKE
jgi:hypothetical protein